MRKYQEMRANSMKKNQKRTIFGLSGQILVCDLEYGQYESMRNLLAYRLPLPHYRGGRGLVLQVFFSRLRSRRGVNKIMPNPSIISHKHLRKKICRSFGKGRSIDKNFR